ncbi:LysE family transporter, partial [Streptomyces lavendulae]
RQPGSHRTSEPETTSTRSDQLVSTSRTAGEPQFLSAQDPVAPQIAALAAAHVAVVLTWLLALASIVATARTTFRAPRFRSLLARVSGAVLIALGLRTAVA